MPSESRKIPLSATEKKAVFNAVSWYDENSAKVIAKTLKLKPNELDALCQRYQCQADELADFGYYATGKAGEYILYETSSDLRDSESIPLKQNIHDYFKAEVQAHISEAWLNMESVKSAMKSASTNTSTATNHYAALQKLPKIFWR